MGKKLTTKDKAKKLLKAKPSAQSDEMMSDASERKKTAAQLKNKAITKKEKLRAKRDRMMQKVVAQKKTPSKAPKASDANAKVQIKKQESIIETVTNLRLALPSFSTKQHDPTAFAEDKAQLAQSHKSRQRLVEVESQHMKAVLQHPSFQADPFETIRQHLTNSVQISNQAHGTDTVDNAAKKSDASMTEKKGPAKQLAKKPTKQISKQR
eukprot:TRINITY_DN7513_c0_g1_i1.p1 TRINITY_DN7513_c0_g1~~TRINITY_DN7513_c0_g1_i1.p1  ORF type:complete len:210 (+),score=72.07 TRINITY_DN7513_c0_g1_i1:105-734(+)